MSYVGEESLTNGVRWDDLEAARSLLANPEIGVRQVADRLGVSLATATLHRYIPAAGTANVLDDEARRAVKVLGYMPSTMPSTMNRR
jgi:hypothetical protein